ncbi:MAG: hypothetical protein WC569_06430 [Candidatus Omnitrophota bacterium]
MNGHTIKTNNMIAAAVVFTLIAVFLYPDPAYPLRPGHGFSEGRKHAAAVEFWEASGIINSSVLAIKELRSEGGVDEEKVIQKVIIALEVQLARGVKTPWLHYDIIGGKSNIVKADNPEETMWILTPGLLKRIKEAAEERGISFIADVHIMVEEVEEDFIQRYIDAGADYVTLHWEGYENKVALAEMIKFIKAQGRRAGLAFNPDINIDGIITFVMINDFQDVIDLFLQMSVYPGKGGQKFMEGVLKNVTKLKTEFGPSALMEIDGGIDPSTAPQAIGAGADVLVAGTAFFGKGEQGKPELENNLDAFIGTIRASRANSGL